MLDGVAQSDRTERRYISIIVFALIRVISAIFLKANAHVSASVELRGSMLHSYAQHLWLYLQVVRKS